MSISPRIIFNCDHIIVNKIKCYGKILMTRDLSGGFPDKVAPNISIIRIDQITDIDEINEYSLGIDYEQKVSNDIIEWINPSNNPSPGEKYYVTASYIKTVIEKSDATNCNRCNGNGWYVDVLGGGEKSISVVSGEEKLTQDFIKVLFTEKGTDGFGSSIKDVLGSNVYNEVELGLQVSEAISDCANQIKEAQKQQLDGGVPLPLEEALDNIEIVQILFVREESTCYISLKIMNEAGSAIKFSFKI